MTYTTSTLPSETAGLTLATYAWEEVGEPRGAVQIAHGLAEHAGRYDRLATALNGAGYLVYAHDTVARARPPVRSGRSVPPGGPGWSLTSPRSAGGSPSSSRSCHGS